MLDAAAGGNLLQKSSKDGYEFIEKMASSSYHPQSNRNAARRPARMHQVDAFTSVAAQLEVMNKRIEELTLGQSAMRIQEVWCEKCGAEHFMKDCQIGNPSYQPEGGMINHNYGKQHQEEKSSMEQMMQKFISSTETRMQNQDASIKNLENQIGQLAKAMSSRELGTLPSDTEKNPKEQVKAVELRSGKRIEGERRGEKESEPAVLEKTAGKSSTLTQPPTSQSNIVIPPPFPAALKKAKLDSQFAKFLEVFKKLNINIPFADALMQMPSYAKFLKGILSNKRKLEEHAMISLTKNYPVLVQNKIPSKQKYPGSFSIPCVINDVQFHKPLCDLGASINLMPYSVFRKLSLGESKSTRMSLQLADRSIKYPRGIIEDVLVKVDKFIFLVDFVVLDMEKDLDMPLILGRHFLAIGKALIDVQKGELLLRVGEEKIYFDVFNALKFSQSDEECFQIDAVDSLLYDYVQDTFQEPLEAALVSPHHEDEVNEGIKEMMTYLNDNQLWRKGGNLRIEDLGDRKDLVLQKPSLEEPPIVELKPLPTHLKYVFLGEMEPRLLDVLKSHKSVFAWKVVDIKGINSSICMHKIIMKVSIKPLIQPQRRLNPKMQEVVKAETIKLLYADIIYPICDSGWVSPIKCVPKKGGITVIENEQNELIPTRTVTGWRVCIDYRKLNDATRKDHFPLPFIDQMLERLAGCMPFGLCNAPATFQRCMTAIFHDMSFDACLNNRNNVLMRCEETNLVLNWEKCHFMVTKGIVLGHQISEQGIEVDKAKAFEFLRERLVTAPVVTSPDWDLLFEVMCDANDSAVGAVLGQRIDKNDIEDIDDWFPDEKLFSIEKSPWYANFANYLVTDTLPYNLSFHQKKKFLSDVKHYFWKEPFLFKICADSMIRRCVEEGEMKSILSHFHGREVDGHAGPIKTVAKHRAYWAIKALNFEFAAACEKRLLELNQLEEFRDQSYDMAVSYKKRTKRIHDRRICQREFKEGEAVLLFNSRLRLFLGKLKSRWSSPYKITKVYPSGAIEIKDARNESFRVNAQRLKHYVGDDVDSTPVITTLTDQD
ncbi:uncharacterized protein [Henckelia pumila]|uniref:uncharacterized protein n=1 Tax=Henckelia pumila TaxID=405737 RepID=UPI003C6E0C14